MKEKITFFKKKWLREHIATIVLCVIAWMGIMVWLMLETQGDDKFLFLGAVGSLLAVLFYVVLYNRMMAYVERRAYPDPDNETENRK